MTTIDEISHTSSSVSRLLANMARGADGAAELTQHCGHDHASGSESRNNELAVGASIGGYVIRRYIAAGGFGFVYEAEDQSSGQRVAIKVLRTSPDGREERIARFMREVRMLESLAHPNIVEILNHGTLDNGHPYYVMEYLDGPTLAKVLDTHHRLSLRQALEYMDPVCAALSAAHEAQFIHRDIKASNIIATTVHGKSVIKLLDFGIAKALATDQQESIVTQAHHRVGSLHAMAPEQLHASAVSPATDIYALGVLLYRMLTGRYPFHTDNPIELERMHLLTPAQHPSDFVPALAALDPVILRCLEKAPSARFPSVDALRLALHEVVDEKPTSSARVTRGIAMHIHAVPLVWDDDDVADDVLEAIESVIDDAEQALGGTDFRITLATGDSLLGIRLPMERGDRSFDHAWHDTAEIARMLHAHAHERVGELVQITVVVHADDVLIHDSHTGPTISGGPLTRLGAWLPETVDTDVYIIPKKGQESSARMTMELGPRTTGAGSLPR